jgi:hypothetical protein
MCGPALFELLPVALPPCWRSGSSPSCTDAGCTEEMGGRGRAMAFVWHTFQRPQGTPLPASLIFVEAKKTFSCRVRQ